MNPPLQIQQIKEYTVVEFRTASLMDPIELERIGKSIYRLVEEEDRRKILLDFERVTFISSQAIGIVMNVRKKLLALPHSKLVLCGVGPRIMEVLKLVGLLKVLTIRPSQHEAINVVAA